MSKGQEAMAVAMMHPEPAKTKRKGSGSLEPKELGISGRSNLFSCLCRRVVDLHKPGQLGRLSGSRRLRGGQPVGRVEFTFTPKHGSRGEGSSGLAFDSATQ